VTTSSATRRPAGLNKPKRCVSCRERVAAWSRPRVDYCYQCLPGGPFEPPACRRCGGTRDTTGYEYYSQGLCAGCHRAAPQRMDACRDCLAWGVIRKYKWLCWRCHSWRQRLPRGTCRICRRGDLPVNPDQVCNLCDRQMVVNLGATVEEANAHGQQLYLANVAWEPTRTRHGNVRRLDKPSARHRPGTPDTVEFYPVTVTQLVLVDMPRNLAAAQAKGAVPEPPDEQMAAFLDAAVLDHARRHGWPKSTIHRTQRSMRVLQVMQDTPGAMLLASDAMQLQQIGLTAIPVIDVATAAGVMLDDRQPAIHAWFSTTIADLPDPMRTEVTEWFDVMLNGSTTPPRRRPRDQQTVRLYLRWAMPALTAWAEQGVQSLREITTADVRAVLPDSGNPRSTMGAGLRSILTLLKARKVLFVNPIARVRTGGHERRDPLPAHADKIRESLLSPNPACAALTALATFHGLRAGELRNMHLTDLADGRLRLGDRSILLAEPVRVRLAAWLDYRTRRWPNTANPHVFLNHRNSSRITPIGARWLTLATGIPIHVLREDRILHEAWATGGDVRRICDLFGLTVEAALRYLPDPEPDDLKAPDDRPRL
jgi:hypothetical protein